MPTAGLKTIIALSFVLALGFLLVILSCALFHSYFPLLVVATYVVAPLPNWICARCANPDDFVESAGAAVVDLGRFLTGFFVVMGMGMFSPPPSLVPSSLHLLQDADSVKHIALPVILAHADIIRTEAMIMSIAGGLLIYGTIISFGMFFQEEQEF
ncbi:hypothetical protein LLEC1_02462 [Akanthomyces lecanii]|uniref:Uncharacterized protein n=1 Tax=Cordyceps confragosa TaxID=2714763 RepID=A0A179IAX8_CORDF|nr:hypothetical protein LLEC1_02462 [Akanthomyces lecanii]